MPFDIDSCVFYRPSHNAPLVRKTNDQNSTQGHQRTTSLPRSIHRKCLHQAATTHLISKGFSRRHQAYSCTPRRLVTQRIMFTTPSHAPLHHRPPTATDCLDPEDHSMQGYDAPKISQLSKTTGGRKRKSSCNFRVLFFLRRYLQASHCIALHCIMHCRILCASLFFSLVISFCPDQLMQLADIRKARLFASFDTAERLLHRHSQPNPVCFLFLFRSASSTVSRCYVKKKKYRLAIKMIKIKYYW